MVPAPSKGWNTFPPTEDNTLEANLARIKILRNELAHSSKMRLKDESYKRKSTVLQKVKFKVSFTFDHVYYTE